MNSIIYAAHKKSAHLLYIGSIMVPPVVHAVNAVSLGCTESLICIPFLTTKLYLPPERRTTFGVNKNTVRLSIGIEDPNLIIEDIRQALCKVNVEPGNIERGEIA